VIPRATTDQFLEIIKQVHKDGAIYMETVVNGMTNEEMTVSFLIHFDIQDSLFVIRYFLILLWEAVVLFEGCG
jgi:hypothetical protein